MNNKTSIKLKAALLIIVFTMNTVVGFACEVGVGMGFNGTHHYDGIDATEKSVHLHADGKKHVHEEKKAQHHSDKDSEKDGCCNDSVSKFQDLDKNLSINTIGTIHLPVLIAVVPNYFNNNTFKYNEVFAQTRSLRFFHPPPPDIRILFQSFQI